jgi:hypothetical protein
LAKQLGVFLRGAGLSDQAGYTFVLYGLRLVGAHIDVQQLIFDRGDAVDAEVEIDDFPGYLPRPELLLCDQCFGDKAWARPA